MENVLMELIAAIVEVEVADIGRETTLETIDWDSLSNLEFISKVDTAFGKSVVADSLVTAKTVGDLIDLIVRG